jgi:hypothetical protein
MGQIEHIHLAQHTLVQSQNDQFASRRDCPNRVPRALPELCPPRHGAKRDHDCERYVDPEELSIQKDSRLSTDCTLGARKPAYLHISISSSGMRLELRTDLTRPVLPSHVFFLNAKKGSHRPYGR